jgi:hypothetical protein
MKTVFKVLVAALVLNASVRGAWAMWQYSQLKDAAQQIVMFGQRASTDELQAGIVSKATELKVPLRADDVNVRREGVRTVAEASYTQPVQFFPNYPYPVKFSFSVDAVALDLGGPKPQ